MNNNKRLIINICASFISLGVSSLISFFMTPYITKNISSDAYGFIQLTNNFIAYISIISIALNSMSSRFISISCFRENIVEANQYFSSTFFSNLILVIVLSPVSIYFISNIDNIINIPYNLVYQVKLLLFLTIINFFITLLTTNLNISYYVKNKLYISSMIGIISSIVRIACLYILFTVGSPSIVYIGITSLVVTLFTQFLNIYFYKKLMPELKINIEYFSLDKTKEMLFSGMWNTITRVGNMFSEGLDLLITNIFINSSDMGLLSVAKTIPNLITSMLNTLISNFMPNLTELYASNNTCEMVKSVKTSMKIIGLLINIPISILIVFGDLFFMLWVPEQNYKLLHILSIITILPWAVIGQATIIHNIFTVINKIKLNSILVCITGILNVLIVFILLKNTNLGLFAVAGVSSLLSIIRNLFYTVPFGAIYINEKWYTFYYEILKSVSSVIIISTIGYLIKSNISINSWFYLISYSILLTAIGVVFNYLIVFNNNDRKKMRKIFLGYYNILRRIK